MTTNREWLYSLDVADLADWFDAEHVETEERALDGDTEPENADSRELILTDLEKKTREWHDYDGNYMRIYSDVAYAQMKELLDRQAAITNKACAYFWQEIAEDRDRAQMKCDELTAERDKLQEQLLIGWECECRLQAERELYRSKFGKCLDYADAIHALMDDEGMA